MGDQGRVESRVWLVLEQGAWREEVAQRAVHTLGEQGEIWRERV